MGKKKKGKQVTKNKSNDKNKNASQNQKQEPNKELSHKMSLEMDQESSQDQTVKSRFSSEGLIVSIENLGSIIETKNKMTRFDKILKILPVVISVSMLIITFFSYKTSVISNEISERSLKISANNNKISERSLEISKANQSLTFDNEIENIKGRGNEYHEDTNGNYKIILPLRVKTRVDSGKAKAVYVVTDDKKEKFDHRFIRFLPDDNQDFELSVSGEKDSIKQFPLDFFIFYIDMFDNISFDYIVLFPKYVVAKYEIAGESRDKLIMKKSPLITLDNYDLLTETMYNEKIEKYQKEGFRVKNYSEVITKSSEIADYIKEKTHVGNNGQDN